MLIVPDMISWQHFVQLPQIKNLPIHEQTRRYNYYLSEQQVVLNQIMAQYNAVGSGGTLQSTEPPLGSNCIQFTADTTIGGTTFSMEIESSVPTTATVDWGDGNSEEIEIDGETQISHEYADEETAYNVTMCFTDPSVITVLNFYGDD